MKRTRYPGCFGKWAEHDQECVRCVTEAACAEKQVEDEKANRVAKKVEGPMNTDWFLVLNSISDYMNKRLKLLKLWNHSMSIDPKIKPGVVKIEMTMTPADGKSWEEILKGLGAKRRKYEFAILNPDGTWSQSIVLEYSAHSAEEYLKSSMGKRETTGFLLLHEGPEEEE